MNHKKEEEKIIIEELKLIYNDFPEGNVIYDDRPDCIVSNIGIELTQYIRKEGKAGAELIGTESMEWDLINLAKGEYERKYPNNPLNVYIDFRNNFQIKKSEKLNISKEISRIVGDHYQQNGNITELDYSELKEYRLENIVDAIAIIKSDGITKNIWFPDVIVIWVWENNAILNHIQEIINEKNKKAEEYLKKCKEIWLVIVAWLKYPISTSIHSGEINKLIEHEYSSKFDKIILYDRFSKKVFPLKKL